MTHRRPRLLLATLYFPPVGMGGVQRPLKFARYLPEFGWDVTVLTPDPAAHMAADESLLRDIPAGVEILRVPWAVPGQAFRVKDRTSTVRRDPPKWTKAIQHWLRWPDDKRGFARIAFSVAIDRHKRDPFNAVLTTSPPPSIHLLGMRLKHNVSIPWVADFRDPWLMRNDDWGPTAIHAAYARRLYRRILQQTDHVIAVNEAIAECQGATGSNSSLEVIHNGYDESDFAAIEAAPPPSTDFSILLYGTFGEPIDPEPVFRLLAEWRRHCPRPLRVRHTGVFRGQSILDVAARHGCSDLVESTGYLPHAAAVSQLIAADCLILPISSEPSYRTTVPGRVFEMLRSQRPIVLLADQAQATRRLIHQFDGVWCVDAGDVTAGCSALDAIADLKRGMPVRTVASIRKFDRREQTGRLAAILDRILSHPTTGAPRG
ncbi:MAG: glycosyltransferase family 4 protein [Candidatus Zixiibacteriota bacterium]